MPQETVASFRPSTVHIYLVIYALLTSQYTAFSLNLALRVRNAFDIFPPVTSRAVYIIASREHASSGRS